MLTNQQYDDHHAALAYQCSELSRYFKFAHLPQHLQDVSRPFSDAAKNLMVILPTNDEKVMALRKLLEAKDCAVRAALPK